ncbi:MAG TPA: TIM barrel protein [Terriglobales bacterium]|nr:TIM barrel protein [Terriglobales bacterium]
MKFAFITLDFKRHRLEDCFAAAARHGLDGIELWGGRPHAWPTDVDAQFARRVLSLKKTYDIEIPMYTPATLGGPYSLVDGTANGRAESMAIFRRSVEAAAAMEIPRVLVTADHPGNFAPMAHVRQLFAENMRELADFAAPLGVTLTLEPVLPVESPVITTADDCAEMLAKVGRPNVDGMLDVVPPTVACEPIQNYFDRLGDKLSYVHLCNSDGKSPAHLRLRDGMLNIPVLLDLLRQKGYDGWVTLELCSEGYRDPEMILMEAMKLIG